MRPSGTRRIVRSSLASFHATCPCLRIDDLPLTLGPHSTRRLELTFDPLEEPEFRGGLAIEISGADSGGLLLFQGLVEVVVKPEEAPAVDGEPEPTGLTVPRPEEAETVLIGREARRR